MFLGLAAGIAFAVFHEIRRGRHGSRRGMIRIHAINRRQGRLHALGTGRKGASSPHRGVGSHAQIVADDLAHQHRAIALDPSRLRRPAVVVAQHVENADAIVRAGRPRLEVFPRRFYRCLGIDELRLVEILLAQLVEFRQLRVGTDRDLVRRARLVAREARSRLLVGNRGGDPAQGHHEREQAQRAQHRIAILSVVRHRRVHHRDEPHLSIGVIPHTASKLHAIAIYFFAKQKSNIAGKAISKENESPHGESHQENFGARTNASIHNKAFQKRLS